MEESNFSTKTNSSDEIQDFFSSLSTENEKKYINALKNSTIKLWTFINEDGLTPLHQSISLNLYELTKELIKAAKNNLDEDEFNNFINFKTNKGQTPLHYASFVGNIKIIKLLLENNADLFAKTNNGFNVLHLATMGNKLTSFFYFTEKYRLDINSKDFKENTCLHSSTYYNSIKIFNYLLTIDKIDINAKNKEGFTALHFAVINKNKSMIKKLLMKGADSSIRNNKLLTPADVAKDNNSIKNIFKGNKCKYQILVYSNYFKIFLLILSLIPFFFLFYLKFDIKLIIYILWIIFFVYLIVRFYSVDPTLYNNRRSYLLNYLETEEQSIEDYCINCQIVQHLNTVHCLICNKCIEGFDHHCFWINRCIGAKNKNYFYHLICGMEIHVFINFMICVISMPRIKNENIEYLFYNDFFRLILIAINTLIFVFSSIIICPLIKFYYYQKREKTSKNIDYDEYKNNRLLNKNNEDDFV